MSADRGTSSGDPSGNAGGDADATLDRRSFVGKVAWVAAGGMLAARAALAQASERTAPYQQGPTGPGPGQGWAYGRQRPKPPFR